MKCIFLMGVTILFALLTSHFLKGSYSGLTDCEPRVGTSIEATAQVPGIVDPYMATNHSSGAFTRKDSFVLSTITMALRPLSDILSSLHRVQSCGSVSAGLSDSSLSSSFSSTTFSTFSYPSPPGNVNRARFKILFSSA
jgi:hypothetical protein